jgi:hypothetical protein
MSAFLPSFTLTFSGGQLVAQFDATQLPAGTTVSVSVVNASGVALAVQPQVTSLGPSSFLIHVPPPTENLVVHALLESSHTQKTAIEQVTIHTLAQVQGLQFIAAAGTVTARWTAPVRAHGVSLDPNSYQFQLLDQNRKPY